MDLRPGGVDNGERMSADGRRAALLDVAKALVKEVGPHAVTMGLVADRARVTRALVYKHFDNSDDLLHALYKREARGLDHHIRAVVEAAPDGFEPKLRAFIGATLDAAEEHGPFFTPLRAAGARGPSARASATATGRPSATSPNGPRRTSGSTSARPVRSSPCSSPASARCSARCARSRGPPSASSCSTPTWR